MTDKSINNLLKLAGMPMLTESAIVPTDDTSDEVEMENIDIGQKMVEFADTVEGKGKQFAQQFRTVGNLLIDDKSLDEISEITGLPGEWISKAMSVAEKAESEDDGVEESTDLSLDSTVTEMLDNGLSDGEFETTVSTDVEDDIPVIVQYRISGADKGTREIAPHPGDLDIVAVIDDQGTDIAGSLDRGMLDYLEDLANDHYNEDKWDDPRY